MVRPIAKACGEAAREKLHLRASCPFFPGVTGMTARSSRVVCPRIRSCIPMNRPDDAPSRRRSMIVDPQLYALFLTAALLLTLAPGPDTMFVLGASLSHGTRGGLLA